MRTSFEIFFFCKIHNTFYRNFIRNIYIMQCIQKKAIFWKESGNNCCIHFMHIKSRRSLNNALNIHRFLTIQIKHNTLHLHQNMKREKGSFSMLLLHLESEIQYFPCSALQLHIFDLINYKQSKPHTWIIWSKQKSCWRREKVFLSMKWNNSWMRFYAFPL